MSSKPTTSVSHVQSELPYKRIVLPKTPSDAVLKGLYEPPYLYSGEKIQDDEPFVEHIVGNKTIDLTSKDDGKIYVGVDGRLIPYDDWKQGAALSLSENVKRLRDDFFNSAESGICVKRVPEQIKALMEQYENSDLDEYHKRPLGALLVGQIFERMTELAPVIERNYKAFEPTRFASQIVDVMDVTGVIHAKKQAQIAVEDRLMKTSEYEEFKSYAEFFLMHDDICQKVRTRTYGADRDQRFHETMTEIIKAFTAINPESSVERNYNRATKIASAMNGIEELGGVMVELAKQLPPQAYPYENLRDGTIEVVEQFVKTAKMRVGIRANDYPAYDDATVQYKAAKDELRVIYQEVGKSLMETEYTHVPSQSRTARAINQITHGIDLIDDICRLRWDLPESRVRYQDESQKLLPKRVVPQHQHQHQHPSSFVDELAQSQQQQQQQQQQQGNART